MELCSFAFNYFENAHFKILLFFIKNSDLAFVFEDVACENVMFCGKQPNHKVNKVALLVVLENYLYILN